jgi:hypothetical protein
MTIALVLAFPATVLIGLATPRQANWLFRAPPSRCRIYGWRLSGWLLLIASLGLVISGDDRTRQIIGWVGTVGVIALSVALVFSGLTQRRKS